MMDLRQPHVRTEINFNQNLIERFILKLADAHDIRIVWVGDTAVLAGVMTVAGGLIGSFAGGMMGAAVGAGIGSVMGVGVSTVVKLSKIWFIVKEKLKDLIFIVVNYLRRLDPDDYQRGIAILTACMSSRTALVLTILGFIACKLGRKVIAKIAIA